jgi:hypothetical protein
VSGVEYVDLRFGYVLAVAFGLAGIEGQIVFAPEDEEPRTGLIYRFAASAGCAVGVARRTLGLKRWAEVGSMREGAVTSVCWSGIGLLRGGLGGVKFRS